MAEQVSGLEQDILGEVDDVTRGIESAKADNDKRKDNLKKVGKSAGGKMAFVGVVVIGMVVGGFVLLGNSTKVESTQDNGGASDVGAVPSVATPNKLDGETTDNYAKLQQLENLDGSKNAAVSGTTHIDSILPAKTVPIEATPQKEAVTPMPPMPIVAPPVVYQMPVQQQQERSNTAAIQNQMSGIMDSWTPSKHQTISFVSGGAQATTPAKTDATPTGNTPLAVGMSHHKVGDQFPAVLTLGANSDEPGVIAARIVHGKYKGAMVTGSFTKGREKMTLKFTTISLPWADKSIKLDSVAIDPNTGSQAIAIDVDHHYMERFALPFLAKFITGYGDVIAKAGTTQTNSALGSSVTTYPKLNGKEQVLAAVGEGASAVGDVLGQNANRQPTIIIPANTPLSLMLLADLDLPDNTEN